MIITIDLPEHLVCRVLLSAAEAGNTLASEVKELLSDVLGLSGEGETEENPEIEDETEPTEENPTL